MSRPLKSVAFLVFIAAVAGFCQRRTDFLVQARDVDLTDAVVTKPFAVGSTPPATCSTGEAFFKSSAPAGENLYLCTSQDMWVLSGPAAPYVAEFPSPTASWIVDGATHGLGTEVEVFVQEDDGGANWKRIYAGSVLINKTTGDVTVDWSEPRSGRMLISQLKGGRAGTTTAVAELHAATHQDGGNDEIATASATPHGIPKADSTGKLAIGWIPAGTGTDITSDLEEDTHASEHKHGGNDEIATSTPGASEIPKAEGTGKLNSGWIPQGTGTDITGDLEEENHGSEHMHGGNDEISTATPGPNQIPKADGTGKLATGWIPDTITTDSELATAIATKEPANPNLQAHIASTDNPHGVTKAQVGLGNVEDTKLSTWHGSSALTTLGTVTTGTIPWGLLSGVPAYEPSNANIQAHIGSMSNPHSVTKAQVGLGSVENTALSTWTGSSSIMTVGTLSSGSIPWSLVTGSPNYEPANANIQSHISSTSNPHSTTKSQLGLSNVENTALSTWAGSGNITAVGSLSSGVVPWSLLTAVPISFTPSAHAETHKAAGTDPISTVTPTPNQVPQADENGKLAAGWLPDFGNWGDVALARSSAGTLEVNNGTVGQYRNLRASSLSLFYDASNSATFSVTSSGALQINPTSSTKQITFGTGPFTIMGTATPQLNAPNNDLILQNATFNGTGGTASPVRVMPYFSSSSGSMVLNALSVLPNINQSGTSTGSYRAFHVNVTETAVRGTNNYLAWLGVGGNAKFTIDTSGNAVTPAGKLATLNACVNSQTGTSYTLSASDNGCVVTFNSASPITLTVPSGLGTGFNVLIVQLGNGQVSLLPSSTSILQRQSMTHTAGQNAIASLVAVATDTFILSGDLE